MYYSVWFSKDAIEKSETATKRDDRIAALDAVIDTLIAAMTKSAINGDKKEYKLDDGQTKIEMVYESVEAIAASIRALETTKQMYLNRNNGRQKKNMDYKNFTGRNWGW